MNGLLFHDQTLQSDLSAYPIVFTTYPVDQSERFLSQLNIVVEPKNVHEQIEFPASDMLEVCRKIDAENTGHELDQCDRVYAESEAFYIGDTLTQFIYKVPFISDKLVEIFSDIPEVGYLILVNHGAFIKIPFSGTALLCRTNDHEGLRSLSKLLS